MSQDNAFLSRENGLEKSWMLLSGSVSRSPYSDYQLLPTMKSFVTQRFDEGVELWEGVTTWLKSKAAKFYNAGISKLAHRYASTIVYNGVLTSAVQIEDCVLANARVAARDYRGFAIQSSRARTSSA
ncbi:hypothetical protein J6590_060278 [Homalodisca vitripennis]|nr:hypothetical protein J6590_060278 [Homalodisca vitripennis]